ncbi:guanine nucleotide-binding protein subunit alpha [Leucosporidium creatinivorum]|uniref:Guanine nucleotide-binding protein subunit alpha n=1 Tax=Leucosporidium creatinivorum TaxID=106004 RepID=A0A1Y2DUA4_9BASI|nr:guanine nucleotide-binding protein subunit alpha [Leucosporidium creatinivorum]
MGCAQSSTTAGIEAGAEEKRTNREIEAQLRKDKEALRTTVKMLLLGAGESGKSTLVKQMRLIYNTDTPYTTSERLSYREVVFANAIQSMAAVIKGFDLLAIPLPEERFADAELLLKADPDALYDEREDRMDLECVRAIERMWREEGCKKAVGEAHKYQLNDSAQYFFDNIARIGAASYIPTDQDILRTRVRSTGITEEVFRVKQYTVRVFDVGGQRSERKKWIHCFENVQVLVFVAAINEYDQNLWEDESVNRMSEALMLFESIASSRWFEKSTFVLLLNKTDLFITKILANTSRLSNFFPEFPAEHDGDVDESKRFMRKLFTSLDKHSIAAGGKGRQLYCHFSCATDTDQVKVVMAAVLDTVLNALLNEVGLL